MKSIELYKAYCALAKLMDSKGVPFRLRVELVKLKQLIEPISIAYEQAENEIVQTYGDKDENGNPKIENQTVCISDQLALKEAKEKMNLLKSETVKIAFTPLEANISECELADITASDIEALLPIIRFI